MTRCRASASPARGIALTHLVLPIRPPADYGGSATCSLVQYINGGNTPISVKIVASCYVDTNNNNLESDCTGTVGWDVRGFKTTVVKNNKADYMYFGAFRAAAGLGGWPQRQRTGSGGGLTCLKAAASSKAVAVGGWRARRRTARQVAPAQAA